MAIATDRTEPIKTAQKRYGTEVDVESIYRISRRTLQKNRLLGRAPNFYRFGRRVLYDLDEIEEMVRGAGGNVRPAA